MTHLNVSTRHLLIQDVSDYCSILKKPLRRILEHYSYTGFDERLIMEWLICDHLWRWHKLRYKMHNCHIRSFVAIQSELDRSLRLPLHVVTNLCIQVPEHHSPFEGRSIDVEFRGRDLYLWYYR